MRHLPVCIAILLAACLGLIGCGGGEGPGGAGEAKSAVRFGTGGTSGVYYAFGTRFSELLAAQEGSRALAVKATAGSAANFRLLRDGFLDLGIVQSDLLSDAINGTGVFTSAGEAAGYAAVAGLYTEACQIVVLKGSGIQSVRDLDGKRVSLGEKESGVLQNAKRILLAHGLSPKTVQPSYLSFADSAAALEKGEIDAFFCIAGTPTPAISDLASRKEIRLVPIQAEALDALMHLYDGYTLCTVPAHTYPGQEEDVPSMGVKAVLMANTSLPDKEVAYITEQIFRHQAQLHADLHLAGTTDLAYATGDIPGTFHAGAAQYYQSQGIQVPAYSGAPGKRVLAGQD